MACAFYYQTHCRSDAYTHAEIKNKKNDKFMPRIARPLRNKGREAHSSGQSAASLASASSHFVYSASI